MRASDDALPMGRSPNLSPLGRGILNSLLVLALLVCSGGASCSRALRNPFTPWSPPAPEVLVTGSSLDQIIAAVNQNAAKIQSLQTNNASITVPGMPGVPLLRGEIAAQRSSRLRIRASTMLTGSEVDLGSNDELFWFWVKRSEPPALYYARHEQFAAGGGQRMLPIEPTWLLDALGFAAFNPADAHAGPRLVEKGRLEIKSVVQGRNGPLVKLTIVDARTAWVLEQHVYDGQGTLLASAVSRSHRYIAEQGVSLPQEIDIRIPASELSLSIDMGTVAVNTLGDNPALWQMPTIPGVPAVDLGAGSGAAAVAPPIGGQITGADWYGPGPAVGAPPAIAIPAPVGPMAAMAPPYGAAAPQSVSPGGMVQPVDSLVGAPPLHTERLPAGGVATQPLLAR